MDVGQATDRRSAFAEALRTIINHKGLSIREIEFEVRKLYGANVTVTAADLWGYLSAERLPRADKLVAICDVCEPSPEQMEALIHSFRTPIKSK